MARAKKIGKTKDDNSKKHNIRPSLSPEAEENQLVALAMMRAKQQLLDGTASSQVITHFLKVGSTKEKLEKEILDKKMDLMEAKTEQLKSAKRIEELYANALEAMRNYSGQSKKDDEIIEDN